MTRPPRIGITMGDPAGIGPEVVVKALTHAGFIGVAACCRPVLIGDGRVMEEAGRRFAPSLRLRRVTAADDACGPGEIALLDLQNVVSGSWQPGVSSPAVAPAVVAAIRTTVELTVSGVLDGVVTAPIQKGLLGAAGAPHQSYPGHTEFLADLAGVKEVGMMLVADPLKALVVTTHVAIRELPTLITTEAVGRAIRLADAAMREAFGIERPRVGVTGLNPHAGEDGQFGREETTAIRPAVFQAQRQGIEASGPYPADTLFRRAAGGAFDVVVAMYHDQALIPVKLLAFGRAVNLTVGLPFVRTSPDHGTAYDIAGQGVADPGSLIAALMLAAQIVGRRPARGSPHPPLPP